MELNNDQRKALKLRVHALKPVVMLGSQGLTEAVLNEVNVALNAHELIKIKLNELDREQRKMVADQICEGMEAELIQSIGRMIAIYRKKSDK